jgi:hypothetical protein
VAVGSGLGVGSAAGVGEAVAAGEAVIPGLGVGAGLGVVSGLAVGDSAVVGVASDDGVRDGSGDVSVASAAIAAGDGPTRTVPFGHKLIAATATTATTRRANPVSRTRWARAAGGVDIFGGVEGVGSFGGGTVPVLGLTRAAGA